MFMNGTFKKTIRFIILLGYILLAGLVPIILLYVGTKQPGINLQIALGEGWTIEPFARLFFGLAYPETSFRSSLNRSISYSTIVASISTLLAFFYANWVTGWAKKTAIAISFTLLCMTLLPQTYLIMPILAIIQAVPFSLPKNLIINSALLICVLPLSLWILHMMSGPRIENLHEMCALDRLRLVRSLKIIVGEIRVDILLVFLLSWTLAWGNYLVPYALGSSISYTAPVLITVFTSNLGRDWAMICAAGFLVCIPGIIIGIALGIMTNNKSRPRA